MEYNDLEMGGQTHPKKGREAMKNRKLLLIVSLVLALTVSLGGTLAYLTDTDADVNTMVLGNVKIEQHEYQRQTAENGDYVTGNVDGRNSYLLEDFKQNKPLLPIVGSPASEDGYASAGYDTIPVRMSQVDSYGGMEVFAGKNAVDKFVTVENTGNSDSYVRTYVAIEVGSTKGEMIGMNYHFTWNATDYDENVEYVQPFFTKIDGNDYMVYEFVYAGWDGGAEGNRHLKGILPAGDTTYPNLSQVYIKSAADNADLEAIDGNDNGKLDILVLSQAVQADGFAATAEKSAAQVALEAGFGKATDLNENGLMNVAAWFGGVLEKDDTLDISFDDFIAKVEAGNGTFDGEGVMVTLKDTERNYQNNNTAQFFIGSKTANIDSNLDTVKISNVTFQFVDDETTNTYTSGELQVFAKNMTFEDCTFIGTSVSPWETTKGAVDCENATFTNCTWKNLAGRFAIHQNQASNLTVTSCDFINCERGIHTNSPKPESITLTKNNFSGISANWGVLCLAENGNYTNVALNISANKADGQVCLWQLNNTVTLAQVNTVFSGIRHGEDYVAKANTIIPTK